MSERDPGGGRGYLYSPARCRAIGKASPPPPVTLCCHSAFLHPQELPIYLPEQCHHLSSASHTSCSLGTFSYQLISGSSLPFFCQFLPYV